MSIAESDVRSDMIMRLYKAGKAAYSDLLDSAGATDVLDSRGNFNYHLNYLLDNSIIIKEGMVYKLTDRGRAIAQFINEVKASWKESEPKLRGSYVSILTYAEDFESECGIRMKEAACQGRFGGKIEVVGDERDIVCLMDEKSCEDEFFSSYEEIPITDLKLLVREAEWKHEKHNLYVLGHPDLTYYLSPDLFGSALRYLQHSFGEAHLYGDKKKPMPFISRARKSGERYEGPAFVIAPIVLEDKEIPI